jgi:hypothetical protein
MVVAQSRTLKKHLKTAAHMLRQFANDVPHALLTEADLKNARG